MPVDLATKRRSIPTRTISHAPGEDSRDPGFGKQHKRGRTLKRPGDRILPTQRNPIIKANPEVGEELIQVLQKKGKAFEGGAMRDQVIGQGVAGRTDWIIARVKSSLARKRQST